MIAQIRSGVVRDLGRDAGAPKFLEHRLQRQARAKRERFSLDNGTRPVPLAALNVEGDRLEAHFLPGRVAEREHALGPRLAQRAPHRRPRIFPADRQHARRRICGVKAAQQLEMVEISMGQKGFLDTHYCIGVSCNPLSPLAYGTEVLETLMAYAKRRQPVFLLPCIMAGITGPMSLWGTIVQQNAEILAGAALTYLVNPETPIVYCPASTAADMRSANVACAAPEQFLINTPGLQLAIDRYRLPTRIIAGMTASKTEDIQAGAETMMSMLIGLLSGGHIILQSFGVLDSIMTTSYEKFVIDEEIFSGALRFCQGVDTSDSAAALKAILDVGPKGSFLMHPTTMQQYKDHWLPIYKLASWENYEAWKEKGREDILVRANRKWKDILANSPDSMIDSELDKTLQDYLRKSS